MRKSKVMKVLTQKAEELTNDIFLHFSLWVKGMRITVIQGIRQRRMRS